MFDQRVRKFLFKCCECEMILSLELSKEEEIKAVNENKMLFECVCGGIQEVLRD